MKKPMPNIKESLDELYSRLHKERKAEVKQRLYMLVLVKEGVLSLGAAEKSNDLFIRV